jgi:hypothetical protein
VLAERYRQKFPLGAAYVQAYEARPVLNVRSDRNRRFQPLSFVEAISQDTQPTVEELLPAYRVAGDAFIGKMKRLFLILDDDEAKNKPSKSGSQKKKNKRHASGEGSIEAKKKNLPSTQ